MNWRHALHQAAVTVVPSAPAEFTGVTADTRHITPGSLFVALAGSNSHGADHALQAVKAGAAAILIDERDRQRLPEAVSVPVLTCANSRRALALLAAALHPEQPRTLVAVTGTNGKTSTAWLCQQLWQHSGRLSASIGTLGVHSNALTIPGSLTTPDPVTLHRQLQQLAQAGVQHAAVEASSHGLHQHRVDGLRLRAAAFTNLSRDHMDYHADEEEYFQAKAALFQRVLPQEDCAVINTGNTWGQRLAADCRAHGQRLLTYQVQGDADLACERSTLLPEGQQLALCYKGELWPDVLLPMAGHFQVENLLAALGLLLVTGSAPEELQQALPMVAAVPGRLQRVSDAGHSFSVYVDYAHTPDALQRALEALRPHVGQGGRLWVVFGCGGNRDAGKRPLMGGIAAAFADRVIVTDDNPRFENAAAIRRAILTACPLAQEVEDRRDAIRQALAQAATGDVVLLAGKGHESGQIVGDRVLPMSDVEAARQLLT